MCVAAAPESPFAPRGAPLLHSPEPRRSLAAVERHVAESGETADAEADFKPKPSKAVVLGVVVLMLLAGIGIAILASRPTREPLRVLVAIDAQGFWWNGSSTSLRLLEGVVPYLNKLGFDAVDGGDGETSKILKGAPSVDEAAKRVHASLIVTGTVEVVVTDLGKQVGMFEVRATGPIHLRRFDGDPRRLGDVRTWSGAADNGEALALAARSLGWQVFDVLLPGLMAHPAVRAIIEGNDRIAAAKLTSAAAYLKRRDTQLEFARSSYAALAQKFAANDSSRVKVTLHSALDRQDGLCATGVAGAFVLSSAIRPFFRPDREDLGYFLELEKLYWQGVDGTRRSLFEGFNVLGYPSATPDGTVGVYVEDLFGAATALDVVSGTAAARRVLLDPKLRLSEPKVAPGGAFAAAWARSCPRCPAAVVVVDLARGAIVHRSDATREVLGGFVWLGPRRLGVLTRATLPDEPPDSEPAPAAPNPDDLDDETEDRTPSQTFTALDFGTNPATVTVLGSVSGAAQLRLPNASADGRRVVFSRRADDGMNLALYDDTAHGLEPLAVERARDPALAPDGSAVAFVRRGEIEVYDLEKRTSTVVTNTDDAFSLRYPQFSLDGQRIYFEIRTKDPVFPTERSISAVASVPAH